MALQRRCTKAAALFNLVNLLLLLVFFNYHDGNWQVAVEQHDIETVRTVRSNKLRRLASEFGQDEGEGRAGDGREPDGSSKSTNDTFMLVVHAAEEMAPKQTRTFAHDRAEEVEKVYTKVRSSVGGSHHRLWGLLGIIFFALVVLVAWRVKKPFSFKIVKDTGLKLLDFSTDLLSVYTYIKGGYKWFAAMGLVFIFGSSTASFVAGRLMREQSPCSWEVLLHITQVHHIVYAYRALTSGLVDGVQFVSIFVEFIFENAPQACLQSYATILGIGQSADVFGIPGTVIFQLSAVLSITLMAVGLAQFSVPPYANPEQPSGLLHRVLGTCGMAEHRIAWFNAFSTTMADLVTCIFGYSLFGAALRDHNLNDHQFNTPFILVLVIHFLICVWIVCLTAEPAYNKTPAKLFISAALCAVCAPPKCLEGLQSCRTQLLLARAMELHTMLILSCLLHGMSAITAIVSDVPLFFAMLLCSSPLFFVELVRPVGSTLFRSVVAMLYLPPGCLLILVVVAAVVVGELIWMGIDLKSSIAMIAAPSVMLRGILFYAAEENDGGYHRVPTSEGGADTTPAAADAVPVPIFAAVWDGDVALFELLAVYTAMARARYPSKAGEAPGPLPLQWCHLRSNEEIKKVFRDRFQEHRSRKDEVYTSVYFAAGVFDLFFLPVITAVLQSASADMDEVAAGLDLLETVLTSHGNMSDITEQMNNKIVVGLQSTCWDEIKSNIDLVQHQSINNPKRFVDALEAMLNAKMDPNLVDKDGKSALALTLELSHVGDPSSTHGRRAALSLLLHGAGIDKHADIRFHCFVSSLHNTMVSTEYRCEAGVDALEQLLDAKMDPNSMAASEGADQPKSPLALMLEAALAEKPGSEGFAVGLRAAASLMLHGADPDHHAMQKLESSLRGDPTGRLLPHLCPLVPGLTRQVVQKEPWRDRLCLDQPAKCEWLKWEDLKKGFRKGEKKETKDVSDAKKKVETMRRWRFEESGAPLTSAYKLARSVLALIMASQANDHTQGEDGEQHRRHLESALQIASEHLHCPLVLMLTRSLRRSQPKERSRAASEADRKASRAAMQAARSAAFPGSRIDRDAEWQLEREWESLRPKSQVRWSSACCPHSQLESQGEESEQDEKFLKLVNLALVEAALELKPELPARWQAIRKKTKEQWMEVDMKVDGENRGQQPVSNPLEAWAELQPVQFFHSG